MSNDYYDVPDSCYDFSEVGEWGRCRIDGKELIMFSKEIYACNILRIEAGTNGYQGGDSGYGGYTFFKIQDLGGSCMKTTLLGEDGEEGLEVVVRGDSELRTMIVALKNIALALEKQAFLLWGASKL